MTPPAAAQAKQASTQSGQDTAPRVGTRKARAPEAKQARADALLRAAEEALLEASYHDITILEVAQRAGLAKGTVYLYYPSKEALFLAVLGKKAQACFDSIEAGVAGENHTAEHIARELASAMLGQHALLSLLSLLFTQLEPGAGIDAVIAFKTELTSRTGTVGEALERAGNLPEGAGHKLIVRAYALAVGLQQFSSPPPEIDRELSKKAPDLRKPPMDVKAELIDCLSDIVRAQKAAVAKAS